MTAYRSCTRVVGTVVIQRLGTSIAEHQTASLQLVLRRSPVHDLTVLREDRRETHHRAISIGNTIERTGDFLLHYPRAAHTHSRRVHLITDDSSTLELINLFLRLCGTHLHDGFDKIHRSTLLLLVRMDTKEVKDLDLDVSAVRRKEMDLTMQPHSVVADSLEALHRSGVAHSDLLSHVVNTVHATVPHDVVDIDVVADECLNVVVNINHAYETVALLTEIIEEGGILTERIICVVRIVCW